MLKIANIKEIFSSTQGEGPYVGCKQLFVRFCGCNLACDFCDTNFDNGLDCVKFSSRELQEYLVKNYDLSLIHSVSYTGGEPLLHVDFLEEFLPIFNFNCYLETNATLPENLSRVLKYVDILSADIKLPSSTGISNTFEKHDEFFAVARRSEKTELFAKVVFDANITEEEIIRTTDLAKKYSFELILQPKTDINGALPQISLIESVFEKFLSKYANTRLIPQVHKFLDIR